MSQEYVLSIAIVAGSVFKVFGIELENDVLEGLVFGVVALWIAIRRKAKGDITLAGFRKDVSSS